MLNNATPIISNVPAKHLNPLLLAQSQWNDAEGFMMIAYSPHLDGSVATPSRFYDLFFLHGSHIYECTRLNSDLRSRLQLDTALKTFQRFGQDETTRVFLFAAPIETLNRFQATFQHEPCLKVQVRGLSVKQIHNLLTGTRCERGIIECNEFVDLVPSIDLRDISAIDDVAQYRIPYKRGRILVYDIERSKGLFEEEIVRDSSQTPTRETTVKRAHGADRPDSDSAGAPSSSQFSASDEKEAEEFTEFIARFLKSTPPDSAGNLNAIDSATGSSRDDNGRSSERQSLQPSLFVVTHREEAPPARTASLRTGSPLQGREHKLPRKPRRSRSPQPSSETTEFIHLFERLFRSFRQQVFDVYGTKSDSIIGDAVRRSQQSTPDFDLQDLSEDTALTILDVIEHIANEAPFLKRSRLRQAILTLAADLYNKQYELLEKNHAIDRVEQFYYKLKK
jgi:hypothetical protein